MAFFYIQAFKHADQVAQGEATLRERLDFTTEAQSTVVINNTDGPLFCRISPDANCQYDVGENPSIVNGSAPLWANQVEHVWLSRGHKFVVAPLV